VNLAEQLIIEAEGLTKRYGSNLALDSVDISIGPGGTGLLGPNGSGKSTMIKTLLGLIQPSSGQAKVMGHDIAESGDLIRQRVGYMAEYDCLNPGLKAVDHVAYSGELLGMNPATAKQRAHETLEYVGLRDQRYRTIDSFSTGMRQSTKLACALVNDPEFLICDEPTNGLDTEIKEFMLNTLNNILANEGRSLLMTSHIMEDVEAVCDKIIMIDRGRVIAQGRIEDLRAIDREVEIHAWGSIDQLERSLLNAGHKVRRRGRILRIPHREGLSAEILDAATKTGTQIRRMVDHEASLEDLFLAVMDRLGYGIGETGPEQEAKV